MKNLIIGAVAFGAPLLLLNLTGVETIGWQAALFFIIGVYTASFEIK